MRIKAGGVGTRSCSIPRARIYFSMSDTLKLVISMGTIVFGVLVAQGSEFIWFYLVGWCFLSLCLWAFGRVPNPFSTSSPRQDGDDDDPFPWHVDVDNIDDDDDATALEKGIEKNYTHRLPKDWTADPKARWEIPRAENEDKWDRLERSAANNVRERRRERKLKRKREEWRQRKRAKLLQSETTGEQS